jgi:hypothetical protein
MNVDTITNKEELTHYQQLAKFQKTDRAPVGKAKVHVEDCCADPFVEIDFLARATLADLEYTSPTATRFVNQMERLS